ncbi:MAG: DUF4129 domain-containing protein [Candidatus Dormibacteria bacterium]
MSPSGRLSRITIFALVGASLAATTTVALAASPVDPTATLQEAQTALEHGQVGLAAQDLRSVDQTIPAAGVIAAELGAGRQVQASRQLQLLLAASSARPPSPAAVGSSLARVYASPQLAGLGRSAPQGGSWLSDLANFAQQQLLRLFRAGGNLLWILLALLLLGAGAVLAVALLQRARSRLPEPSDGQLPAGAQPTRVRPERLFARADQLLADGRFREAIRASFQALLLSAGDRRVLQVDPSWTNSELLRAARQVADLEPALRPLVAQFNAVVYGGRDPGRQGCSQFTAACRAAAGGLGP